MSSHFSAFSIELAFKLGQCAWQAYDQRLKGKHRASTGLSRTCAAVMPKYNCPYRSFRFDTGRPWLDLLAVTEL